MSAAWSADGSLGFVGTLNEGGALWRTDNGARLHQWNHDTGENSAIRSAAFSGNGAYVGTTVGSELVLWDVITGARLRHWQAPSRILSLSLSEDGGFAFLGLESNEAVMFYTLEGGLVGRLQHDRPVLSVATSNDANRGLSAAGSTVRLWSLATGRQLMAFDVGAPIDFVTLSPDGNLGLVAAYMDKVVLTDLSGVRPIHHTLYERNPGISTARFSGDGQHLLLGTAREKVFLWDLQTKTLAEEWEVPITGKWVKAAILSVAFGERDGQYLAAASSGYSYVLEGG